MPGVAKRTTDIAMFAAGAAPLAVDVTVASIASLDIHRFVQTNIEWLVNIMTLSTGWHCLGRKMRFMALGTGGDVAMLVVVATAAFLLRVFAWLGLKLLSLVTVAIRADARQ